LTEQNPIISDQYRQVQMETATTLDLVRMAYDGIIGNLNEAVEFTQSTPGSYDVFNDKLATAQQLVEALYDGLDENHGDLAMMLAEFYDFVRKKIIESNMEKSIDGVKEIIELVEQVRDYWQAAVDNPESETDDSRVSDNQPRIDSAR
jgi:flagellar protein FliS